MKRNLTDWLEYYLQFTQNSEPPIQYHLWSGISALSSVLQRKCYCNWGLRGYIYPNFYVALVGPPGGRKGTAMKIAKGMVQQLEIPMGSDALGSIQIMYKEISKAQAEYREADGVIKFHKSLAVWSEEFQVFLSDKDQMLLSSLTDLFDCANSWKYSTLSRGVDDLSNCYLTIIGAITPSLLQSKLSMDAVGGGLISRIIFVVGYGAIKRIALPFLSKEELQLQTHLQEDLEQIHNLAGAFELTKEFLDTWIPWYETISTMNEVDNDKFMGYNSRRALHLNKLCMIFSASENNDMKIEARHFDKALAVLEETEEEMPNAFYGLGRGAHSEIFTSFLNFLDTHPEFNFAQLTEAFQLDSMPVDMEQFIRMAEITGKLRIEKSATETRYITIKDVKIKKDKSYLKETVYSKMG